MEGEERSKRVVKGAIWKIEPRGLSGVSEE